ncbi:hypothetical protein D9M71_611840 [compost metagenome]
MSMNCHGARQLCRTNPLGFMHLTGLQVTKGSRAFGHQRHFGIALGLRYRVFIKALQCFFDPSCRQIGNSQQRRRAETSDRVIIR